ncbi:hypothetical protein BU16DRAFT_555583 [Lophium mytilinum]|uniref:Uncharacterized protein n=1 Tax=Lophium mytilinum TaxID=390894 RepID=A0A6A6R9B1_9PEZI|nr:hypothetical protein BU16DRAFT_555583 [Lophium mytilinum]
MARCKSIFDILDNKTAMAYLATGILVTTLIAFAAMQYMNQTMERMRREVRKGYEQKLADSQAFNQSLVDVSRDLQASMKAQNQALQDTVAHLSGLLSENEPARSERSTEAVWNGATGKDDGEGRSVSSRIKKWLKGSKSVISMQCEDFIVASDAGRNANATESIVKETEEDATADGHIDEGMKAAAKGPLFNDASSTVGTEGSSSRRRTELLSDGEWEIVEAVNGV